MNTVDLPFMQRALLLAERGLFTTDPNPRVGCVLVRDNKIIAEGWHQHAGGPHAEIQALQQATSAQGATCYVTLEPCCHWGKTGPCGDALIRAGVSRVVVAMSDPNPLVAGQGLTQLRAAGISVDTGLLATEAAALNPGFIKRMHCGMPYVRAKIATSLDGRTALTNGTSQWITGVAARGDNQLLRARSSAILTGINTILDDDPCLSVRLNTSNRQPLRIIVDSQLRMPLNARCLQPPDKLMVATCSVDQQKRTQCEQAGAEVVCLPSKNSRVDLAALLQYLARQQCNEIQVEAGATLLGALLAEHLIDELVIYSAPRLLGDQARPMVYLPQLTDLAAAIDLEIVTLVQVGADIKIVAKLKSAYS